MMEESEIDPVCLYLLLCAVGTQACPGVALSECSDGASIQHSTISIIIVVTAITAVVV